MCLMPQFWEGTKSEPLVRRDMETPDGEEYKYKDRMNRVAIQSILDSCLLTDEEMALGPDQWRETMAHLDTIQLELPDGEDEDEEEEDEMEVDSNEGHQSEECRKACEEKQKWLME